MSGIMATLSSLEERKRYHFRDKTLMSRALTHHTANRKKCPNKDGEVLEVVGDYGLGNFFAKANYHGIGSWCDFWAVPKNPKETMPINNVFPLLVGPTLTFTLCDTPFFTPKTLKRLAISASQSAVTGERLYLGVFKIRGKLNPPKHAYTDCSVSRVRILDLPQKWN